MARQGPIGFQNIYLPPVLGATTAPLSAAAPLAPLYPKFDLARAARAHSFDMQETPCTVRHTDCNGTSQFVRISKFYPDGIRDEALLKVASSANQYFHTPRHYVRALICGGTYDETQPDWPVNNCPGPGSGAADARNALLDAAALRVGMGLRCELGQLGTPCSLTMDFTNFPAIDVYINKIRSAAHSFSGVAPAKTDQIVFIANYFDTAGPPRTPQVWFDGAFLDMTCDPDFGTPANCAYRSMPVAVNVADTTSSNCRLYFFQFVDSAGVTQRYPEAGAFWTFGEGRCFLDWIPQAEADVVIAARNAGQPFSPPFVPAPGTGNSKPVDPLLLAIIICSVVVGVILIVFIVVCCFTRDKDSRWRRKKRVAEDEYIRLDEPVGRPSFGGQSSMDSRRSDGPARRDSEASEVSQGGLDYRFITSASEPLRNSAIPQQGSSTLRGRPAYDESLQVEDYLTTGGGAGGGGGGRPLSTMRPLPALPPEESVPAWAQTQHGGTFSEFPSGTFTNTMGVDTYGAPGQTRGGGPGTTTMEALISEVPRPFDVLYTYNPSTLGELPVKQGEVVFVLPGDEHHPGGWAYVENDRGATGYIPAAYISLRATGNYK